MLVEIIKAKDLKQFMAIIDEDRNLHGILLVHEMDGSIHAASKDKSFKFRKNENIKIGRMG